MRKLYVILSSVLLILSGCNMRVLDPKSQTAKGQSFLIQFSFALMMIVFTTVIVLFIWFVWKYRQTEENKHRIPEDEKGNRFFEITWTVLPIILLAVLAVPTIKITYEISASSSATPPNAVHIDVTAQQFSWTFEYQNGVVQTSELVIPKDRPVVFHLNSDDVIHSFWVPKLGGKMDVIPGKERRLIVTPDEIGTYQGKCAEFCGKEHSLMRFETIVKTQEDYKQWIQKMKRKTE
ncbi:cytochrome c oxidase subunit II [Pontibacillus sp. HMF3514]|uniref:cytochrome c oxidase subunit II n=1 Tax=Pontibacillus sp. HMF3514 TaxID=2692425 RepID=UPI00131FA20D|nr:cytochrome c oxidase subunit II [Pontibacillus sp. HMF3514]QHE53893.1 cytochrome c oxidase subunit II [Pontibacillus sp. HMF3514]